MNTTVANKPRIKLIGRANWQCADGRLSRCGKNWKQAYDRWLLASLKQAQAGLQPDVKRAPKQTFEPRDLGSALTSAGLAMPKRGSPAPQVAVRQAGSATPKGVGKPITVKAVPKAAPIEQPAYSEAVVRQVAGAMNRRPYQPSAALLQNMERASMHQRPLVSISGKEQ